MSALMYSVWLSPTSPGISKAMGLSLQVSSSLKNGASYQSNDTWPPSGNKIISLLYFKSGNLRPLILWATAVWPNVPKHQKVGQYFSCIVGQFVNKKCLKGPGPQ